MGDLSAPNSPAVIKCLDCSLELPLNYLSVFCPCGGLLQVEFKRLPEVSWEVFRSREFRLWRYRELIPLPREAEIVSLDEGGTPLIRLGRLKDVIREVYVKFEGANPTGSFKDRGMTVAVSMAKYLGAEIVACASTGNTSASMSAYASRAGLKALVVLPEGKVSEGKLMQAILHGATLLYVTGNFDKALETVIKLSSEYSIYILNSLNPWRIEGQKTLAYEIADELGVPEWVILPVGNGGNITAVWKGFKELREAGLIDSLPRLAGIQAEGASPLAKAFNQGKEIPEFLDNPETIATAIRIGKPVNWSRALKAVRESEGVMISVSDDEILRAQALLARNEGLGVEPASAASLAGLIKLRKEKIADREDKVVLIATGHALKDPGIIRHYSFRIYHLNQDELNKIIRDVIGKDNYISEVKYNN